MFAVWFAAAWIGVVLLYCLFRVCGGRLADILSCRCFSGPCCSCWGVGGRLERGDVEYPFGPYDLYDPYHVPQGGGGPLPVIVIKTSGDDDGSSSSDDADGAGGDDALADNGESEAVRALRASDENRRERSDAALLLQNQTRRERGVAPPIVV